MSRHAAVSTLLRWKENPVAFVRECLGVEPDAWQAEALAAFPSSKRLAMKAAKGPGKTTVLAWLVWNFLLTRPNANVAATSISGDNLKDGLWKELAKWQQVSPLLRDAFDWQRERIVSKEAPATWWASARQWSKSADAQAQADTLAGLHSDFALFVLDESGGIPQAVMATAEAILASGIETKLVQAGNPTSLEGPLYRACVTDRHLWTVIEVTGDPDDPKRSPRIDIEWARQQIATYGRDQAWVRVNVLGQFPASSLNVLLGPEDVQDAMKRQVTPDVYRWAQKRLGVDVARFGDDRTVLFPRQGKVAFQPVVMRHARGSAPSTDIAARVMAAKAKWGADGNEVVEIFDGTGGWAAGAVDVLRAGGCTPMDVQFHSPATDPRFLNRRAEMWWGMCDWIRGGGCLPNIPELIGELTTPTYTYSTNGRLQIEPKDAVKKRLGRSPDLADALALTFSLAEMPANYGLMRQHTSRYDTEWNPYEERRGDDARAALSNFDPYRPDSL